jgi:hypothetical protein
MGASSSQNKSEQSHKTLTELGCNNFWFGQLLLQKSIRLEIGHLFFNIQTQINYAKINSIQINYTQLNSIKINYTQIKHEILFLYR